MILLIALAGLVLWATVATVIELRRDGYRHQPTDWSRVPGHEPELTRSNR
jgi:hypothetical protein